MTRPQTHCCAYVTPVHAIHLRFAIFCVVSSLHYVKMTTALLPLQDDGLLSKVGIRVLTSFSANFEISCWFVANDAASF